MGIIILCLVQFLGCSREVKTLKVDLIVKETDSEFWISLYKGATAAANYYGIELNYLGPDEESDYTEQIDIFEKSIKKSPDAIILAAGDYYLMKEPVNRAKIPIIIVDSLVQGEEWDTYIATDNYNIGVKLAKEIIERFGTSGKVGVVNYIKNTSTAIDRSKGFIDTLEENSQLEIVDLMYCDGNIELATEQTRLMLNKNPDIDVMVGLNAQSTIGIARFIKERDALEPFIFVGGVDCLVEEANYIDMGILQVTILQNPYMMGYYSVENAYKLITGNTVEKNIFVDTYIIDKESLYDKESQELIFPFD